MDSGFQLRWNALPCPNGKRTVPKFNVAEVVNNNPVLRSVHSRSAVGKVMTTAQAEKIMLETASLMVLSP